ncbi:MAG: hypothetical protein NZM31_12185 [Gemmatales bacterium]|nr:hypothetical protein [Gemmatales bacterium]MDW8265773.1 hypothetical protein [Gemmataceae bacterium]MDW8387753.1 hypothetical protein [Gemmatales bacterium]
MRGLLGLILGLLGASLVLGGDGETVGRPANNPALRPDDLPRRVLILTDETTLQGQVQQRDKVYEVRTSSGVVYIPAVRVQRLCESLEEAYEFLRSRPVRDEVQDALRLARWCAKNGLTEQARQEAQRVLRIHPEHREARRLAGLSSVETPSLLPVSGPISGQLPARSQAGNDAKSTNRSPAEPTEHRYTPEMLRNFAQRVQPILFNSCATAACHGGNRGLAFELQRPPSHGVVQPMTTRHNLVQTLRFLDPEDPPNSELLRKAIEAHGGRPKPPLPNKDAPAYQTLETWVFSVHPPRKPLPLDGDIPDAASPLPKEPPGGPDLESASGSTPRLPSSVSDKFAADQAASPPDSPDPAIASQPPSPSLNPSLSQPDPYDPAPFNARYHPKGPPGSKASAGKVETGNRGGN